MKEYKFPCPICRRALTVKITKNDKLYVVCNPCGVQLFVRSEEGIKKFIEILEDI